jgi:hypothetical protein
MPRLPLYRKASKLSTEGLDLVGTPGKMTGFTCAVPFPHPPLIGADSPLAFGHP